MRHFKSWLAGCAGVLALAGGGAQAQSLGPYLSLHGGALLVPNTEATFLVGPPSVLGTVDNDNGVRVGGAIGYDFPSGLALELETSFAKADVNTISISGLPPPVAANGDAITLTIGGNVLFGDTFGPWRLYGGAGAGAARQSINVHPDAPLQAGLDDDDWTWMAQVLAGLEVNLGPSLSLGGRYRFQHIGSTDFSDGDGDPVHVKDYNTQSIEFTLRLHR